MISCINEGKLRACLDRELSEDDATAVSEHLLECKPCRARLELLRARAASVAAVVDSLDPVSTGPQLGAEEALDRIQSRARANYVRRLLWAPLAVGVLTLFLVAVTVTEKRAHTPVVKQAADAPPLPPAQETLRAPTIKPLSTGSAGSTPRKVDYFLPLDDGEPIQMGFVVRVNLPASVLSPWEGGAGVGEIQADVIVDEAGRARAVRFLK